MYDARAEPLGDEGGDEDDCAQEDVVDEDDAEEERVVPGEGEVGGSRPVEVADKLPRLGDDRGEGEGELCPAEVVSAQTSKRRKAKSKRPLVEADIFAMSCSSPSDACASLPLTASSGLSAPSPAGNSMTMENVLFQTGLKPLPLTTPVLKVVAPPPLRGLDDGCAGLLGLSIGLAMRLSL